MKNIMLQNEVFFPKVGGIQTTLKEIAFELEKMGFNVTILTWRFSKKLKKKERISDNIIIKRYDIDRNRYNLFYPLKHFHFLKRYLKKEIPKYDLIISRHPLMGLASLYSSDDKNKIMYIPAAILTMLMTKPKYRYGLWKNIKIIASMIKYFQEGIMQKQLLKKCKKTITFSKEMDKQIKEFIGDNKNVHHIKPGIKSDIEKLDKNESKKKIGFSKDDTVFLYVGRIAKIKNISMLVKSFSELDGNSKLAIVGDGEDIEKDLVDKNIEKYNLQNKIKLFGRQSELSVYYSASDYLVLPSNYETFGMVIIEALKCGTPVVGFKNNPPKVKTAIDEIITDEVNGFLISDFSENELVKVLRKAQSYLSKDKYKILSANAEKSSSQYSWRNFTHNLIDLSIIKPEKF